MSSVISLAGGAGWREYKAMRTVLRLRQVGGQLSPNCMLASTLGSAYWKKLTCGVVRSFNWWIPLSGLSEAMTTFKLRGRRKTWRECHVAWQGQYLVQIRSVWKAIVRASRSIWDALHSTHYTSHSQLHPLHSTLRTHLSTLFTPPSTLHTLRSTPHCTLHTLHFALHTPHSTLYAPHSTLYTLHFTLQTSLYTLHSTLLHSSLCTSHSTLYTLHSTPHALHSALRTLDFTLCIPHSTLHTFHPTPSSHSALCTPPPTFHSLQCTGTVRGEKCTRLFKQLVSQKCFSWLHSGSCILFSRV